MALNEIEMQRCKKRVTAFIEKRRPPLHIRPQLDLGFSVKGQSVEIFEIRPVWQNPEKKMGHPVAKATYVKNQNIWKVYWMRADLKWHAYTPLPEVANLDEFLQLVDQDTHACFWG
jgi:Protein of unknown function (DUF3024)